jgi:hypothetical protein
MMLKDDDLVAGFEAGTLTEFHHADHVQLTIVYLARLGRDGALQRLISGLRRFATAKGHPEKFHLTMTRAWLELIESARHAHPEVAGAEALVAACPALLDRHALDRCYSRERLESERARTEWMPPDLGPLHLGMEALSDRHEQL